MEFQISRPSGTVGAAGTDLGDAIADAAADAGLSVEGLQGDFAALAAQIMQARAAADFDVPDRKSRGGGGGDGHIEHFAKGGIVDPSAQGTLAVLAEAGETEYVVPQSRLADFVGSVGGGQSGPIIGNVTYIVEGGGDIESIKLALQQNTDDLTGTIVRELEIQAGINGGQ